MKKKTEKSDRFNPMICAKLATEVNKNTKTVGDAFNNDWL